MKTRILFLLLILPFLFCHVNFAQGGIDRGVRTIENERKIALVIGNTNYDASIGRLKHPVNDAADVGDALQRLGFTLVGGKPQLDVDKKQMLELIREFGRQIKQGGVGFFYFSGHGVQVSKENYLVPITDDMVYEDDGQTEAVNVDMVAKEMEMAENRLNILVLDACRNNQLLKRGKTIGIGLAEPSRKPEGTFIAFAAGDGQTASDGTERNGLFTQELLKNLERPNIRLDDIFRTTRNEVKRLSDGRQVPILSDSTSQAIILKSGENENLSTKWSKFSGLAKSLMKYDFIGRFSENLAAARINNKWGFIDKSGKSIIAFKYDKIYAFSEGFAPVMVNAKWGFIDNTGKEIITPKYDELGSFSEGLARVKLNDKWGSIDKTGRIVIPIKYEEIYESSEGLIGAKLENKFGFLDKKGNIIIPFKYDDARSFSEGLAAVSLDGTSYKFIDRSEKVVISAEEYDNAGSFSGGVAEVAIEVDQKEISENTVEMIYNWGFINTQGKKVTEIKYDETNEFSEGLAVVVKNKKQGYIDKNGRELIPLKYDVDECGCGNSSFSGGLAQVTLNDKYGFIDTKGEEVIPIKYEHIWCYSFRKDGFIGVILNDKKGFVDLYGNEYFDF